MQIPFCSFQVHRRHRASHPPRVSNIIRICVLSNVSWSHSHAPRRRPHVVTSSHPSGGVPYPVPPTTTAKLSHDGTHVPPLHHRTAHDWEKGEGSFQSAGLMASEGKGRSAEGRSRCHAGEDPTQGEWSVEEYVFCRYAGNALTYTRRNVDIYSTTQMIMCGTNK